MDDDTFVKTREEPRQWRLMFAVYETVIAGKSAIYCSGPITSGRLAMAWFQRHPSQPHDIDKLPENLRREFNEAVVGENMKRLRFIVSKLRNETAKTVIDPSALPENDWKQEQWREFWCRVIARFGEAIVLAPEWEFSKGACVECLFGLCSGVPVRRSDGKAVDLQGAKECINLAVNEMRDNGFDIRFFEKLLSTIGVERHKS